MDVVELTRELVSIPSHEDETRAGDYVEDWLDSETAAAVERDDHGNVFARVGGGEREPTLALTGHHDVVPPAPSQLEADGAYRVYEDEGRLYGRGTADMKGCLAAAMCALRDVDPGALEGELAVASFVREEAGTLGSKAAVEDGFAPDYAIVGEGSTGYSNAGVTDVAVAHKGARSATITAHGKSAHVSETGAGENAIYRATDAVESLRRLDPPSTEVLGHPLEGSVTVTEIEGGTDWNVVPDSCTLTVDERTVPGDRAPIERLGSGEGVSVAFDRDMPPMACGDEAFADLVLDVARDVQADRERSPQHVVKPHATDAGRLATAGADCVVVGAAEPGEAHTADESVSIHVLERCYEIYRTVAERFGQFNR